jgi:hypothetical protein
MKVIPYGREVLCKYIWTFPPTNGDIFSLLSYFEKIEQVYNNTLLSVCVCVCLYIPPIVARQRLGKSPLIVATFSMQPASY